MQLVSSQREISMAITEKLSRKTAGENISPTCYYTIHSIESFIVNMFFFSKGVFLSHKLARPKNGLNFYNIGRNITVNRRKSNDC